MIKKLPLLLGYLTIVTLAAGAFAAVSTDQIDLVYNKAFVNSQDLSQSDLRVIDRYVEAVFAEFFLEEDASEIVKVRAQFSRRRGNQPSQYSMRFISTTRSELEKAFEYVATIDEGDRQRILRQNLVILVAELESVKVMDFGLRALGDESAMIRYWAVKSVANPQVIKQLNSSGDQAVIAQIAGLFGQVAEQEKHGVILNLITRFAGFVNSPEAKALLIKITDLRLESYEKWDVDYEKMEATLLKLLAAEILASTSEQHEKQVSAKFAQLYSYVMQRLILGADVLDAKSKAQLASVTVEIEQNILESLLGKAQSTIKDAVEVSKSGNYFALEREEQALLGSAGRAGELALALGFDYGTDSAGQSLTVPKRLAPPSKPAEVSSESE